MTSPQQGMTRKRELRGRVLVVGGTVAAREFASAARKVLPAVSEAASIYDALADIAMSTDREPIAAVAIASDAEHFDAEAVSEAFARTDSSIPVVLLFPAGDVDMQAIGAVVGFEEMIPLPARAGDITRVFTDLGIIDPSKDAGSARSDPAAPTVPQPNRVVDLHIQKAYAQVHPEAEAGTGEANGEPSNSASAVARVRQPGSAPKPTATASTNTPPELQTRPPQSHAPARSRGSASEERRPAAGELPRDSVPSAQQQRPSAPSASPDFPFSAPPEQRSPDPQQARERHRRRSDGSLKDPHASNSEASASHASPSASDELPSDLDLIRALRTGDDLQAVAIRTLCAHLGCGDIRLALPTRPGEEDAVGRDRGALGAARVQGAKIYYGVLLSASRSADELAPWAGWLAEWLDFEQEHLLHRRLAWSDELTGAGNRRALFDFAPRALKQAADARRQVSLMFFDIDDFKKYNDQYGHEAGDEILRETVAVMRECIRPGDHIFRLGGDEFVILFCDPDSGARPDAIPEDVSAIAERCRQKLASTSSPIALLGRPGAGAITLSAGCAVFPWQGSTLPELLRLADARALEAKREGKNQVNFGPDAMSGGPSDSLGFE